MAGGEDIGMFHGYIVTLPVLIAGTGQRGKTMQILC
jgi:hypothetical protein